MQSAEIGLLALAWDWLGRLEEDHGPPGIQRVRMFTRRGSQALTRRRGLGATAQPSQP